MKWQGSARTPISRWSKQIEDFAQMSDTTVRQIDLIEFDRLGGRHAEGLAAGLTEELGFFASSSDQLLGVLIHDRSDRDYAFVVLGRDPHDVFRAIDFGASSATVEAAKTRLQIAMLSCIAVGRTVWDQDEPEDWIAEIQEAGTRVVPPGPTPTTSYPPDSLTATLSAAWDAFAISLKKQPAYRTAQRASYTRAWHSGIAAVLARDLLHGDADTIGLRSFLTGRTPHPVDQVRLLREVVLPAWEQCRRRHKNWTNLHRDAMIGGGTSVMTLFACGVPLATIRAEVAGVAPKAKTSAPTVALRIDLDWAFEAALQARQQALIIELKPTVAQWAQATLLTSQDRLKTDQTAQSTTTLTTRALSGVWVALAMIVNRNLPAGVVAIVAANEATAEKVAEAWQQAATQMLGAHRWAPPT
jgi:hypothetical protein